MSSQRYFKFLVASTISLTAWICYPFIIQPRIFAQTKPDTATEPINIKNRLSSPWENAVLSKTLESATAINNIKFSPDGQILASVSASQVTLWRVKQGEIQRILPGHYATELGLEIAPTAIAFSPDSRFVATATWSQGLLTPDRSLVVWDTDTGEEVLSLKDNNGCRQVLFDTTGDILYGACDLGVTAWSFPEGKKLFSFDPEYPVEAIALHPQGNIMATVDANTSGGQQGEKNNQIQLWQLNKDNSVLLNTLDGHANDIARIEFTANGNKLVTSSYDGKINVWNWQQGTSDRLTNNLYSNNGLFSLSADSRLIAGNFHSSIVTDLVTGLPLRNVMVTSPRQKAKLVAFSPDGSVFAKIEPSEPSDRSQIHLWQTNVSQPATVTTSADKYLSLDIAEYWSSGQSEAVTESNTERPASIGKDPQAIALSALGLTEIVESEQERVEIDYPQNNLAVVTITQTNLLDDSVEGIRYQVKFAPYGDRDRQQWQVVWAGQQFKCHQNRGHQDWNKNWCQ